MSRFVDIAIEETANKLGLEKKVVKQIIMHYFSSVYVELHRGIRDIKLLGFFTIKKNSKYELFRSRWKIRLANRTRGSGDQGI